MSRNLTGTGVKSSLHKLRTRDKTELEWYEAPQQCIPERQLAVAVLQRAVMDLLTIGVADEDRASAHKWINGEYSDEYERDHQFSFSRIVGMFSDMPPEEFRRKIMQFVEDAHGQKKLADNFRFQRGKKHTKDGASRNGLSMVS